MKLQQKYKVLLFLLLTSSVSIFGQNTISVKKSSKTLEAIFQSEEQNNKNTSYYCFKKDGYVYFFTSNLKEKKIIQNCKEQQWLKTNSTRGSYLFHHDSITISPITYSVYGEEQTNDFYYIATLLNTQLKVVAVGKKTKKRFNLLYPIPLVIEKP